MFFSVKKYQGHLKPDALYPGEQSANSIYNHEKCNCYRNRRHRVAGTCKLLFRPDRFPDYRTHKAWRPDNGGTGFPGLPGAVAVFCKVSQAAIALIRFRYPDFEGCAAVLSGNLLFVTGYTDYL